MAKNGSSANVVPSGCTLIVKYSTALAIYLKSCCKIQRADGSTCVQDVGTRRLTHPVQLRYQRQTASKDLTVMKARPSMLRL